MSPASPAHPEITIQESPIEAALQVHAQIPEFNQDPKAGGKPAAAETFQSRYQNKLHVIFVAYGDETPVGYLIAYDKFGDGSIYCWMAGVIPSCRKQGALKKLMEALEAWCKSRGISTIHIKTRNRRREMLSYLIQSGWMLTEVQGEEDIEENRILMKKILKST